MSNGFPRSPRVEDCGDETINQLIDAGLLADPSASTDEHPWAKRLFRQFKAGSDKLTKIDAYAIGNELNRQAARIRELENGGRTYSAQSPDVGQPPSADVGREPRTACGGDCDLPGVDPCEERSVTGLLCTLPDGHEGEHVACSELRHGIAVWSDSPRPRDVTDEQVDDALHAEAFNGEGGR